MPWSPTKYIPFYGGADHHDYHHYVGGQSHSNFASVFTYCDFIYGTDKVSFYAIHVTSYSYIKKVDLLILSGWFWPGLPLSEETACKGKVQ